MKVFPHGTGNGDKPTGYLLREDYPGRKTHPPHLLRGDPALTRQLIDSIDRRWKFTAGVLAWHPDDKVSEEQENEVMDAFEKIAFAGLEADQRNILWVRHTHANHHELHFVIPRMELSSGKDFNACPPGWQKDFSVFRDLFNWREHWARPDDPARARETLPKKADLYKARMERWGKEIIIDDRDRAKDEIHARLKTLIDEGKIKNRDDVIQALKNLVLTINRAGKDYISVKTANGLKLRFKGVIYAENWKRDDKPVPEDESEAERQQKAKVLIARLEGDFERVIKKRAICNVKRYPEKWVKLEDSEKLPLPEKEPAHEPDRGNLADQHEKTGGGLSEAGNCHVQADVQAGGRIEHDKIGIADIKRYVLGCQILVRELAELIRQAQRRSMNEQGQRRRMR